MTRNRPVAHEGGKHLLMPQILGPRLELFERPTGLLAEDDERGPEAVWVVIGKSGPVKALLKISRIGPALPHGRRAKPTTAKPPSGPTSTSVAGNNGSS